MFNELTQIDFDIACNDHIQRLKKCEGWLEDSYAPQTMPDNFKALFTQLDAIKPNEAGHYTQAHLAAIANTQRALASLIQNNINSIFRTLTRNRGLNSVYSLISMELNNNKFPHQITIQDPDTATHRMARILSPYIAGEGYTVRDIRERRKSVAERSTEEPALPRKRHPTDP